MVWDETHVGRRVVYTGRNGNSKTGVIRSVVQTGSSQFVNLKLDGSSRDNFGVPGDTIQLVPDELGNLELS